MKRVHAPDKETPVVQHAVKRSDLLNAIRVIKQHNYAKIQREVTRYCSLSIGSTNADRWIFVRPTKKTSLLCALRNAVSRHDWSTAAQCVSFLLDYTGNMTYVYRMIIHIMFNHPSTTKEMIRQFLAEVLNLRTTEEQNEFVKKLFVKQGSPSIQDDSSFEDSDSD